MSESEARQPGEMPRDRLHAYVRESWRAASRLHALAECDLPPRDVRDAPAGSAPGVRELVDRGVPEAVRRMSAAPSGMFAIRRWQSRLKPTRDRSPDFWLWSCRIVGDTSVVADAEMIACAVDGMRAAKLTPAHVKVRISHRGAVESLLSRRGVEPDRHHRWFPLLHRAGKMSNDDFVTEAGNLGMEAKTAVDLLRVLAMSTPFEEPTTHLFLSEQAGGRGPEYFKSLFAALRGLGVADWCVLNLGIVRGGAGHTGMVFEVHSTLGRGRSIAGGGRSVVERPDAAGGAVHLVGFDMGDAPIVAAMENSGAALDAVSRAAAQPVADVYLACIDDADAPAALLPTVAMLRRCGIGVAYRTEPVSGMDEALRAASAVGGAPGDARQVALIEAGGFPGAVRLRETRGDAPHLPAVPFSRLADKLTHR